MAESISVWVTLAQQLPLIIAALTSAVAAWRSNSAANSSETAAKTGAENKATIEGIDRSLSKNNETTDEIHSFAARMSQLTQENRNETAALLRKVVAAARKEAMEESARHIAVLEGIVSTSRQQIESDRTRIVALEAMAQNNRERIDVTEHVVQKMSDSQMGLPKMTEALMDELIGKSAETPVPVVVMNPPEKPAIVRVEPEKG